MEAWCSEEGRRCESLIGVTKESIRARTRSRTAATASWSTTSPPPLPSTTPIRTMLPANTTLLSNSDSFPNSNGLWKRVHLQVSVCDRRFHSRNSCNSLSTKPQQLHLLSHTSVLYELDSSCISYLCQSILCACYSIYEYSKLSDRNETIQKQVGVQLVRVVYIFTSCLWITVFWLCPGLIQIRLLWLIPIAVHCVSNCAIFTLHTVKLG